MHFKRGGFMWKKWEEPQLLSVFSPAEWGEGGGAVKAGTLRIFPQARVPLTGYHAHAYVHGTLPLTISLLSFLSKFEPKFKMIMSLRGYDCTLQVAYSL